MWCPDIEKNPLFLPYLCRMSSQFLVNIIVFCLTYEIDEMAVLALYNRISNIQRLDRATTLTEVKEIVDEAIANSEKFSIKKVFFSKKYKDDDYVILHEKDFEE